MQQTDRGNYRTKESIGQQFYHSCLGKLLILVAFCCGLLLVAHLTVPDEETMLAEMDDNIRQCIEDNDSIKTDKIDDFVHNIGYIFTTADSIPDKELIENFSRYNKMKYFPHTFHATTLLYNNMKPEGIRVGIGIFGIVIPTVNFNDFLIRLGPMHKGYDQKAIKGTIIVGSEHWSNNPELGL